VLSSRRATGVDELVCVALGDIEIPAELALVDAVGGAESRFVAGGGAPLDARLAVAFPPAELLPPVPVVAPEPLVARGVLLVARVGVGLAGWGQIVF